MSKSSITIKLDESVKKELEKRAKREMMDVDELIEDILRRSVVSSKKGTSGTDNVDDKFLSYFSRKQKVDYIKKLRDKLKGKGSSSQAKKPFYEGMWK